MSQVDIPFCGSCSTYVTYKNNLCIRCWKVNNRLKRAKEQDRCLILTVAVMTLIVMASTFFAFWLNVYGG